MKWNEPSIYHINMINIDNSPEKNEYLRLVKSPNYPLNFNGWRAFTANKFTFYMMPIEKNIVLNSESFETAIMSLSVNDLALIGV